MWSWPWTVFYNSTNFNDTIKCNYFDETTFNEADQIKNGRIDGALSMCHLDIRSIRKTGVFVETINAFIEKIKPENKYCYLMGDYNINILNFATLSATADFVDSMYSYGFFPLINRPTRITTSSATIIDNIFTNNLFHAGASCQGILVTYISDHLLIFHINCCQKYHKSPIYLSLRETFLSIKDNPFRMPKMKLIGRKSTHNTTHRAPSRGSTQILPTYITSIFLFETLNYDIAIESLGSLKLSFSLILTMFLHIL